MPRYVVERSFAPISDEEMQELLVSAMASDPEYFSEVQWEHTHVCHAPDGGIKAFCVYTSPNAQILYDHARRIDAPSTHHVRELVGDLHPGDLAG